MSGGVFGAAVVIVALAGGADAGGPDSDSGERRGAPFADGMVGPIGGAGGCGDATGTPGISSAGVAGTGPGVAGNDDVSALVSVSAVLMRCHRLGSLAWGSMMPASGDMT